MTIEKDIYEKMINWAQHEFDVCFVIRVEEISWRLWREISKAGLELAESDVEDAARAIIGQLVPPGGSIEQGLVNKAYRDAMHRYVVDAVYTGLSLPTFWEPSGNLISPYRLPNPELFIYTQVGTVWIECETLTGKGAVSTLVSILYKHLQIAKRFTEYYDKFVFVVPKESGYRRGILEDLIKQEAPQEPRISILSL